MNHGIIRKKIKNWLITGDTHGKVVSRLCEISEKYNPEETALIILGDAGINYYLNKTDEKYKKIINESGYAIYCVRGNHEERPENLPFILWSHDENVDNMVIIEPDYPNIRYFVDGWDYKINGYNTLILGGAYSVDKWYRLGRCGATTENPESKKTGWFPEEQLSLEEMEDIEKLWTGKSFDIILSHTCPESFEPKDLFLPGLDQSTVDKTMEKWMDEFKDKINWKLWLFGHFHADRYIAPGVEMFYYKVENIENILKRHEIEV